MPGTPSSHIDLWPDSWRRHAEPRYRVNLAVVGVVLVLAPIGIAGSLFARDNVIAARYALAVAVLGALIVWIGVESRLRLRRASARLMAVTHDAERPGLQIPYSRRIHVLITALMGAFALVFIMAAVDSAGSGGVYFWSALAVVCASFPVLLLRRKYTLGYVLLTSDGVLHRGWAFRSFLPWAGIDMIHPLQTDGPDILITARDGTPWEHADHSPVASRQAGLHTQRRRPRNQARHSHPGQVPRRRPRACPGNPRLLRPASRSPVRTRQRRLTAAGPLTHPRLRLVTTAWAALATVSVLAAHHVGRRPGSARTSTGELRCPIRRTRQPPPGRLRSAVPVQAPDASARWNADGKRCSASHTRQQTSSKAKSSRKPSRMSA